MKRIDSRAGSALILAVVLTSLLAVVGVIFIMAARVERVVTSSIAENRELNFAVETVVAKISQELALDVPGAGKNQEYYDYPGPNDIWLASLEPYEENGQYYWKQVSDVTGFLDRENWDTQDIKIGTDAIIEDHNKIDLDRDGNIKDQTGAQGGQLADADGDGVADSKWIELDNITSGKGKPVYAAIRVIDNGGMLNVNTAYKFDANETDPNLIDGSSQTQINLLDLSERGANPAAQDKLDDARFGSEPPNLNDYIRNIVWRYYLPDGEYTPFDISDEMELRNRFLLNHLNIDTRIEKDLWANAFEKPNLEVPVDTGGIKQLTDWFYRAQHDIIGPNDIYSYRHIATTYNTDRIIKPDRLKMININKETDVQKLYDVLVSSIAPDIGSSDRQRIKERFAQLAANMADYVDGDTEVTVFKPEGITYYGFEAQPFISEVAMKIDTFPDINPSYFAVELYNPFNKEINLEKFELELYDNDGAIGSGSVAHTVTFDSEDVLEPGRCFVIANNLSEFNIYGKTDKNTKQDPKLKFFGGWIPPMEAAAPRDQRRAPGEGQPPRPTSWQRDTSLRLRQKAENGEWIYIDKQFLDRSLAPANKQRAYGRDARDWHIVYPTLREDTGVSRGSLGLKNDIDPGKFKDQKHNFSFFLPRPISSDPPMREKTEFVTIGDITRILTIGNNTGPDQTIGEQLEQTLSSDEDTIRLDLRNPYHRNIFQYLTVFDPTADGIDNDGDGKIDDDTYDDKDRSEWKISGRININTAPWFVIKQLPWVTDKIARAVVAYRDKLEAPVNYKTGRYNAIRNKIDSSFARQDIRETAGFETIGELNFVIGGDDEYSIAKYALDGEDLKDFPDLTTDSIGGGDGITNDFEERDIIFSRISNLVTVRSDVFTAYILVRIGADGPQKRVIALLDRSDVYTGNGKVKLVALQPVPDPR